MISIDRLSMEFSADTYAFARDLYKSWDEFFRRSAEKVIDDVLSPFDRTNEVIEIEYLEVNVGVLTEADFQEHFPVQFARSLYEQFTAFLYQAATACTVGVRITPVLTRHAEWLFFFLSNGYLPSLFVDEVHSLSVLLASVTGSKDPSWMSSLQKEWHRMSVRERLVMQFDDDELQGVVTAFQVENASFIQSFTHYTIRCQPRSPYSYIPQSSYRTVVWILVLTYLMKEGDSFFSHKQFILYTVRELAAHYNLNYLDILRALFAYTVAAKADIRANKLVVLLEEIDQTEHYSDIGQRDSSATLHPGIVHSNNIHSNIIHPELQLKTSSAHITETEKNANTFSVAGKVSFEDGRQPNGNGPAMEGNKQYGLMGRIEVPNAGLVLLAPYLPLLFERLSLTANKHFIDDASAVKAIFILQQLLVDEWDAVGEHELVLNRLLTGYTDTGKPLPCSVELAQADRDCCRSLLDSIRHNWAAMKNTSIHSFQQAFLQRKGLLEQKENHWVLKVEGKAYDVLLDTIPWTYTSIKYPWMAIPVHVQWR